MNKHGFFLNLLGRFRGLLEPLSANGKGLKAAKD